MAKRTKQLLEETQVDFSRLQEELESAKNTRDQYSRLLKNARARLARRKNDDYPNQIATGYITSLKSGNIPETTLIQAIDSAIETNIEFSDRTYKIHLYAVANNKDIYKYLVTGAGWGTNLDLQIVYEEVAGDLDDWAEGISNYREAVLKTKGLDDDTKGEKATDWWYDNVYGFDLEGKTISGRLSVTPHGKAPFWRILNSGSVELASDRPGGYNPVPASPTDFIGTAERTIEKDFLKFMREAQEKRFQESKEIQEIVDEHQAKRDEYSSEVEKIKTDMRLNEKIFKSFGDKKAFIDKDVLAKAIRLMENDELFKTRKVNIAKSGSGVNIFITLKKLEGTIEI